MSKLTLDYCCRPCFKVRLKDLVCWTKVLFSSLFAELSGIHHCLFELDLKMPSRRRSSSATGFHMSNRPITVTHDCQSANKKSDFLLQKTICTRWKTCHLRDSWKLKENTTRPQIFRQSPQSSLSCLTLHR